MAMDIHLIKKYKEVVYKQSYKVKKYQSDKIVELMGEDKLIRIIKTNS